MVSLSNGFNILINCWRLATPTIGESEPLLLEICLTTLVWLIIPLTLTPSRNEEMSDRSSSSLIPKKSSSFNMAQPFIDDIHDPQTNYSRNLDSPSLDMAESPSLALFGIQSIPGHKKGRKTGLVVFVYKDTRFF